MHYFKRLPKAVHSAIVQTNWLIQFNSCSHSLFDGMRTYVCGTHPTMNAAVMCNAYVVVSNDETSNAMQYIRREVQTVKISVGDREMYSTHNNNNYYVLN